MPARDAKGRFVGANRAQEDALRRLWDEMGIKKAPPKKAPKPVKADFEQLISNEQEWLLTHGGSANLQHFAFIYESGETLHYCTYCWAAATNSYGKKPGKIAYILDNVFIYDDVKDREPSQDELDYINWVVNESVFAPIFITKDPHTIWDKGVVCKVCRDIPSEIYISGMVALRYLTELPAVTHGAIHAFKAGLSREEALIAGMVCSYRDNQWIWTFQNSSGAHGVFNLHELGKAGIANWLNKNVKAWRNSEWRVTNCIPFKRLADAWNEGAPRLLCNISPDLNKRSVENAWGAQQFISDTITDENFPKMFRGWLKQIWGYNA